MKITRRKFSIGASTGILAVAGLAVPDLAIPALAQGRVSPAELMAPGPLPEMSLGNAKAPVTIVEYASMSCRHCAAFHAQTYPQLKTKYIDTGKVRFIFRELLLERVGMVASMLARCVGPERFFPMVETLFHQQRDWTAERPLAPLLAISKQQGMTEQAFNECLNDQKLLDNIQKTSDQGKMKFGVNETPTLFVNGKRIPGLHKEITIADLEKEIEPFLKR